MARGSQSSRSVLVNLAFERGAVRCGVVREYYCDGRICDGGWVVGSHSIEGQQDGRGIAYEACIFMRWAEPCSCDWEAPAAEYGRGMGHSCRIYWKT